jgi:hypothetical protein
MDANMAGCWVEMKTQHGWKHGWWGGLESPPWMETSRMVGGLENPPRMRTWIVVRYEKHDVFSSYYDMFRVSKHVPYARQCWLGPTNHVRVFLFYGSVVGRLCWLDSSLSSHKNELILISTTICYQSICICVYECVFFVGCFNFCKDSKHEESSK